MTNKADLLALADRRKLQRVLAEWRAWKAAWLNGFASGICFALACVFAWLAMGHGQ